jgi:hypothetical protein
VSHSEQERRRHRRLLREERLFVQIASVGSEPEATERTFPCSTLDVSAEGLRLLLDRPLEIGCSIELWVEVTGRQGKYFLAGQVRWVTSTPEGHLAGIALAPRSGDDLMAWRALFA